MEKEHRKLSRSLTPPPSEARRKDTHEKIQLGGLVVKAGLRNADAAFLLGVLMDASTKLQTDPEYRARMMDLGRKGFLS